MFKSLRKFLYCFQISIIWKKRKLMLNIKTLITASKMIIDRDYWVQSFRGLIGRTTKKASVLGDNLTLNRRRRIRITLLRISLIKSQNLLRMFCWMMDSITFMGNFFRSICIHMPKLLREKIIIWGLIPIWFSKTIWWVKRQGAHSKNMINRPRKDRLSLVLMRMKILRTIREWWMVEYRPMATRDK